MKSFFAFLWSVPIIIALPLILLSLSVAHVLLNENSLKQKIIPSTYVPATSLFAEKFTSDAQDAVFLGQRLRTILFQEDYQSLFENFISTLQTKIEFTDDASGIVRVDMTTMKEELLSRSPAFLQRVPICNAGESINSFRFCIPRDGNSGFSREQIQVNITGIIKKEIPSILELKLGAPNIGSNVEDVKKYGARVVPTFILFVCIIIAGFALILRSLPAFFGWIGTVATAGGGLAGIAAVVFARLIQNFNSSELGISNATLDLMQEIVNPILRFFSFVSLSVVITGLICILLSFISRKQKHESA